MMFEWLAKEAIYIHLLGPSMAISCWKLPLESHQVCFFITTPFRGFACPASSSSNSISRSPVNARIGMKEKFSYSLWVNHHEKKKKWIGTFPFDVNSGGWKTKRSFSKRFFLSQIFMLCLCLQEACDWNSRVLVWDFEIFYLPTTSTPAFFALFKSDEKDPFTSEPACLSILSVQNLENGRKKCLYRLDVVYGNTDIDLSGLTNWKGKRLACWPR